MPSIKDSAAKDAASVKEPTSAGKLFGEASMLALARAYQQSTDWHLKHPKGLS